MGNTVTFTGLQSAEQSVSLSSFTITNKRNHLHSLFINVTTLTPSVVGRRPLLGLCNTYLEMPFSDLFTNISASYIFFIIFQSIYLRCPDIIFDCQCNIARFHIILHYVYDKKFE